jgi:peptidylamidoglycolate lyase
MQKGAAIFLLCMSVYNCKDPVEKKATIDPAGPEHYQLVKDWPRLPAEYLLGNPSGMAVDRAGNVFVFHRGTKKWPLLLPFSKSIIRENTILVLDRKTGQIVNSWGGNIFIMPHSLTIDQNDDVWVSDVGLQQVLKFTHDGKLLMRIGEAGVSGNDSTHFNRPTDVAVALNGSFYVSDGYRNSRVVKFSASGQYLFSWGKKGDGPGEFNIPHGITLDDRGNVYVADRENSRIQVFDPSGKFIKEWKDKSFGKIYAIRYDRSGNEFVAVDYITDLISPKGSDIINFDPNGHIKQRFGRTGGYQGPVCRYHDLAIDADGSVYVGDILGDRIQKFERLGANVH